MRQMISNLIYCIKDSLILIFLLRLLQLLILFLIEVLLIFLCLIIINFILLLNRYPSILFIRSFKQQAILSWDLKEIEFLQPSKHHLFAIVVDDCSLSFTSYCEDMHAFRVQDNIFTLLHVHKAGDFWFPHLEAFVPEEEAAAIPESIGEVHYDYVQGVDVNRFVTDN